MRDALENITGLTIFFLPPPRVFIFFHPRVLHSCTPYICDHHPPVTVCSFYTCSRSLCAQLVCILQVKHAQRFVFFILPKRGVPLFGAVHTRICSRRFSHPVRLNLGTTAAAANQPPPRTYPCFASQVFSRRRDSFTTTRLVFPHDVYQTL